MPSLGSLRSSSCILLTQLQAHIGTSCGPRSKDPHWMMGKQVHFLDKAIMSNPSSTTVSIFFFSMSGLHNENMALWNGLFFGTKIIF